MSFRIRGKVLPTPFFTSINVEIVRREVEFFATYIINWCTAPILVYIVEVII